MNRLNVGQLEGIDAGQRITQSLQGCTPAEDQHTASFDRRV
jgi:hypothetical protein